MSATKISLLLALTLLAGCATPAEKKDAYGAPGTVPVKTQKTLQERPPLLEKDYRARYEEAPPDVLFVTPENRFYGYAGGVRYYLAQPGNLWYPGEPEDNNERGPRPTGK